MVFLSRVKKKYCYSVKSANFYLLKKAFLLSICTENMIVLSPSLCDYTFSINEVLAMHMHKEHNGAAPVQKSCDMCLLTSHLSRVLKNHIDRKNLGILEMFECNKCNFSAKIKCVLKNREYLKHKKSNPNM